MMSPRPINRVVASPSLLERLRQHRTVGQAPADEMAWLLAHGTLLRFEPGDIIVSPREPVSLFYIVLDGHIAIHIDRGAGSRKVMEWHGGDVTGVLPYSRLAHSPGDVVAEERTDIFAIPGDQMPALIRECPVLTEVLVHVMLDRTRVFTSSDLHDEKMASLGRLSAGLAHELNNPASAATRSAGLLASALSEADEAARTLGAAGLTPEQVAAVDALRQTCHGTSTPPIRSAIDRADREDAIATWLADHDVDEGAAAALTDTAVTLDDLDALAASLDGPPLDAAMRWIAAGCSAHSLALEVQRATSRIYDLVSAVKRFTYMDRATAPEPVDVGRALADTVAVLGSKARAKSISISLELAPDVPPVLGRGGELNQVWMNLLDNALDAAPEAGHVQIQVTRELSRVEVRVIDDGAGIDPAHRQRIFDPFFTTKPVGSGTGLGLDIARRVVVRHQGEIDVESRPGRTAFRVSLPAAEG